MGCKDKHDEYILNCQTPSKRYRKAPVTGFLSCLVFIESSHCIHTSRRKAGWATKKLLQQRIFSLQKLRSLADGEGGAGRWGRRAIQCFKHWRCNTRKELHAKLKLTMEENWGGLFMFQVNDVYQIYYGGKLGSVIYAPDKWCASSLLWRKTGVGYLRSRKMVCIKFTTEENWGRLFTLQINGVHQFTFRANAGS